MSETSLPAVAAHGATHLPAVDLYSYNVELKDDEGFIGDRASKGAFREIIETGVTPFESWGRTRSERMKARLSRKGSWTTF